HFAAPKSCHSPNTPSRIVRFVWRISTRHRTPGVQSHPSKAADNRRCAIGRRPQMVRTIARARIKFDEGRSHARRIFMSDSLFDLSGRVAIVTGTSRGLGQYFARALAKAGADLVLTSRERSRLLPFAEEMQGLGRRALSLELDVRNHDSIERMAATAEEEFGHLD